MKKWRQQNFIGNLGIDGKGNADEASSQRLQFMFRWPRTVLTNISDSPTQQGEEVEGNPLSESFSIAQHGKAIKIKDCNKNAHH